MFPFMDLSDNINIVIKYFVHLFYVIQDNSED